MVLEVGWLFEPFQRFALDTVGVWYVATMVAMAVLSIIVEYVFDWETTDPFPDHYSVWMKLITAGIVAPLLEETLFRIVVVELGFGTAVVVAASILWVLMHGKRGLIILVTVPVYVKMALAGMYVEMILVHAFHNTWLVLLSHAIDTYWSERDLTNRVNCV